MRSGLCGLPVLVGLIGLGCLGVQAGVQAGHAGPGGDFASGNLTWAAHMAAYYLNEPRQRGGMLAGFEVEGRARQEYGSEWMMGALAGYSRNPSLLEGGWGWMGHLDIGGPMRRSQLFPDGAFYTGASFSLIYLGSHDDLEDVNRSVRFIGGKYEWLFPTVRVRLYRTPLDMGTTDLDTEWEVSVGLGVRLRLLTDVL